MTKTTENNRLHLLNPHIASQIGEPESILLNQINYWLSKSGKHIDNLNGSWIYNSHQEWLKQFSYWSLSKLRRTIKSLETLGLIISVKVNSKKWDQTKWYTINYEKYSELFRTKYLKSSNSKLSIMRKMQSTNQSDCLVDSSSSNKNYSDSRYFVENQVTKVENTTLKVRNKMSKKESSILKGTKLNIKKNASQHAEICICPKWTNQSVQNEQMLTVTKNNYTNISSSEFKNKNIYDKEEINFSSPLKKRKVQQTGLTKNETKLIEQMVELWNKVFSYSINPIKAYVSKDNRKTLLNSLNNHFTRDLSKWQEYAKKVNSSQFLMGEKKTKQNFKAAFSWLIKPEVIEKIMNDEYGVGDRGLDMNNLDKNIEQKKNEVVNKMDKKVSEFIKNNINQTKERAAFKEYVKNSAYDFDGDEYRIMTVIKHIPYFNLFETEKYKCVKENLFGSYITKKYMKVTKTEIRKKFNKKIDELVKKEKDKYLVIEELKRKERSIEQLVVNNKNIASELEKLI